MRAGAVQQDALRLLGDKATREELRISWSREPVGMERLELCRDEEQARLCWLNLLKGKIS